MRYCRSRQSKLLDIQHFQVSRRWSYADEDAKSIRRKCSYDDDDGDEEVGSVTSCSFSCRFSLGTGILLSGLKACSNLRDLDCGQRLHWSSPHFGHVFVANSLVNMYAKCGNLSEACSMFRAMPCRNQASWNTMIAGYADSGHCAAALQVFFAMEELQRNSLTFVAAAMACSGLAAQEESRIVDGTMMKLVCLETGMEIYSAAKKAGCGNDVRVTSSLVDMFAKCGSMVNARELFVSMHHRDVVCWTSIIQGYADNGRGEEALDLFSAMSGECHPNSRTFVAVLLGCSCLASQELGREVDGRVVKVTTLEVAMATHSRAVEATVDSDVYVASSLVDLYAKCGSLKDARMVFDRMKQRDVVLWTSLLLGYVENGEFEHALELFQCMVSEGCEPTSHSFVAGLLACGNLAVDEPGKQVEGMRVKLSSLDKGIAVHSRSAGSSGSGNIFLENTLIDMYCKCGSPLDSRRVFDKMPHHNIVSWNALIAGYAENREAELALELFSRLEWEPELEPAPNAVTFAAVLLACTELASLQPGKEIHSRTCRSGLESEEVVANKLVDLYGKCGGGMAEAEFIVSTMEKPSLVTWNGLIAGYSRRGGETWGRVFSSFERMRGEETTPDEVTFLLLLTACSHAGLVDRGRAYFDAMVCEWKLAPVIEHYHCLVDMFGRANRLEEALEVARSMPYRATCVTWKTILSSCRKWRNVEVGRVAFDFLLALESDEEGDKRAAFLLMANLYGSLGMWNEQVKILEMRHRCE